MAIQRSTKPEEEGNAATTATPKPVKPLAIVGPVGSPFGGTFVLEEDVKNLQKIIEENNRPNVFRQKKTKQR